MTTCAHDVDIRDGERCLTAEELAPVLVKALQGQLVAAVQAAVAEAIAQVTVATAVRGTCSKCGATCVVGATLRVREGAPAVETEIGTLQ